MADEKTYENDSSKHVGHTLMLTKVGEQRKFQNDEHKNLFPNVKVKIIWILKKRLNKIENSSKNSLEIFELSVSFPVKKLLIHRNKKFKKS